MRLSTPAHEQPHALSVALDVAGGGHRHQPALVRVEAADLEAEVVGGRGCFEVGDRFWIRIMDRRARDAVGNDDRVDSALPHVELLLPADRVVRVPEDDHAIAQPTVVQRIRKEVHRPRRVPLLSHDDHVATGGERGRDDVVDQAGREARVPVADLLLLSVVDTSTVARRDPLAPAPVDEPARIVTLLTGKVRVATEIEVCLVAELRERARKALDSDSKTAGLTVHIRALEAEDHDNSPPRLEDHHPSSFRARYAIACSSAVGAQTSVVRVSSVQGNFASELPLRSVAKPPASETMRRLAAMSNTRTGIGAQNASMLPAAVCAIASAIDPRMRILCACLRRPRALTSALGRLSRAISSMRSRSVRGIGVIAMPPRQAPCLRIAVQASPLTRLTTQPATVSPMLGPSISASITAKNGIPCLALRLPSTGSTSTSG